MSMCWLQCYSVRCFCRLALHIWISLGHCQNNAWWGRASGIHSLSLTPWVQYLDVCRVCHTNILCNCLCNILQLCIAHARGRTTEHVRVKTEFRLLVPLPLIWTNTIVLRRDFWWNLKLAGHVCKLDAIFCLNASCASLHNPRWHFPQQNSEFPRRRYWNSSMTWSKVVNESVQIAALWEWFNPTMVKYCCTILSWFFSILITFSSRTSHFLVLHLLNFTVFVSSPRFIETPIQAAFVPLACNVCCTTDWAAKQVSNKWDANGWRVVIYIWGFHIEL